ncbi:hypothetical protein LTR56_017197 [Elasticomyces elasticus]|nr:hypothetical protein LTR56_017197 [Elasticomyces elasticus]KAK3666313.1 hypothetical protein LTR22_002977 [Elasticomyces elasticus]KAK4926909.1 hypothetical protein LTR49_006325 [Elasticomyces elasticus]
MLNDRDADILHLPDQARATALLLCGHEQVEVNKCRYAERTDRVCGELELSEEPEVRVKEKGCGFLLGRDEYFNGGEWCLSVVPVHERISGTRNPEKARREQEREERRVQESKGPLTEEQRQSFGDEVRRANAYFEGRLYQERR